MKAATWQRLLSTAASLLLLALVVQPSPARPTTLPAGLPALPSLGETMQRSLRSGVALNGFDPVAYRIEGRATPGLARYELMHGGAVWRFASAANREAFRDAPEIYEPAFAGFDPTGVAEGLAVDTDPRQFAIVGSRLFLFRTPENRRSFIADATLLRRAESNWAQVYRVIAR